VPWGPARYGGCEPTGRGTRRLLLLERLGGGRGAVLAGDGDSDGHRVLAMALVGGPRHVGVGAGLAGLCGAQHVDVVDVHSFSPCGRGGSPGRP